MSLDRPCYQHPDRPAEAYCEKFDRYLCAQCIRCREPKNHCKHRTMCMIWEWQKHGLPPELESEASQPAKPTPKPTQNEGPPEGTR